MFMSIPTNYTTILPVDFKSRNDFNFANCTSYCELFLHKSYKKFLNGKPKSSQNYKKKTFTY